MDIIFRSGTIFWNTCRSEFAILHIKGDPDPETWISWKHYCMPSLESAVTQGARQSRHQKWTELVKMALEPFRQTRMAKQPVRILTYFRFHGVSLVLYEQRTVPFLCSWKRYSWYLKISCLPDTALSPGAVEWNAVCRSKTLYN